MKVLKLQVLFSFMAGIHQNSKITTLFQVLLSLWLEFTKIKKITTLLQVLLSFMAGIHQN